jgi:hypothetical protein
MLSCLCLIGVSFLEESPSIVIPISMFKNYGWTIKAFSLLRDHFRDVSFVSLNHARSEVERYNSGLRPSNSV